LAIGCSPNVDGRPAYEAVLETALQQHREGTLNPFTAASSHQPRGQLRNMSIEQANALMDSCSDIKDWTRLGEEQRGAHDCPLYTILECRRDTGWVVARILDPEPGDRLGELAMWSNFLACHPDLCPDFATGEPRTDGVLTCEMAYKVRPVGQSIVKP
jgi:hypothetical protein